MVRIVINSPSLSPFLLHLGRTRPAPLPGSPTHPYITSPPPLAFLLLLPFPMSLNGIDLGQRTLDLHPFALTMSSILPWIPEARQCPCLVPQCTPYPSPCSPFTWSPRLGVLARSQTCRPPLATPSCRLQRHHTRTRKQWCYTFLLHPRPSTTHQTPCWPRKHHLVSDKLAHLFPGFQLPEISLWMLYSMAPFGGQTPLIPKAASPPAPCPPRAGARL
jgi:hypothetical protein